MKFFVACAKGLEYLLVDELLGLGATRATAAVAGINVEGDATLPYRAVLHSRLASRVHWPLAEFECPDENALYEAVHAIDWREHLASDGTLAIDAHVSGSATHMDVRVPRAQEAQKRPLTHERYATQRIKDAIVDRLRFDTGTRPDVDTEHPDLRLGFVLRKGRGMLSVDLGGGPLHKRGWRIAQGEAPLKENLAAAMLIRGKWPQVHREGGALLDPMCGSGTLLIEGALMVADEAPGLRRHGNAEPSRWLGFDKATWHALVAEAKERAAAGRAALQPVFFGADADPQALHAAVANADRAGVGDLLKLERRAVSALAAPGPQRGLVVCNPPYNERLAADPALYRELGDALRRAVPDWRASLLCGDDALSRATGLRAEKTYTLFNGALECTLLLCDPVLPPQREARPPAPLGEGATMVANRLRKNLKKLKSWRERNHVTCYRAYDADLPEYAAAIDVYTADDADHTVHLHVQEYAPPASVPEDDARRRFGELLQAVRDVFALPPERIATKTRARGKGGSKYGRMDRRGEVVIVREGAARLEVNLHDYLDTGLFLDHRPLRRRLALDSDGLRVLNLFCYTGAASVQAGLGGAATTTSVDLSPTYLEWAARNLARNGLTGAKHRLVQADALAWLEAEHAQYDLVFCDPPTFSNSKKAEDFDTQRDHVRLLRAAVDRLAPRGLLLFSNNYRRFRLDEAAVAEFATAREISPATLDPDFERNPRIHRAWEIRAA